MERSALAATRFVAEDLAQRRRDTELQDAEEDARNLSRAASAARQLVPGGGHLVADAAADGLAALGLGGIPLAADSVANRLLDLIRVRLYAFGDHLKTNIGAGRLVNISTSLSWDALKGVLMNELFGPTHNIHNMDFSKVHLYLLPDGELLSSPEYLFANDKILVYAGETPLGGSLTDPANVSIFASDMRSFMSPFRRPGASALRMGGAGPPRPSGELSRTSSSKRVLRTVPLLVSMAPARSGTGTDAPIDLMGRPDADIKALPRSATGYQGVGAAGQAKDVDGGFGGVRFLEGHTSFVGMLPTGVAPTFGTAQPRSILAAPKPRRAGDEDDDDDDEAIAVVDGNLEGVAAPGSTHVTGSSSIIQLAGASGSGGDELTPRSAHRAIIREKFRKAVRRLVMVHKMEQMPAAVYRGAGGRMRRLSSTSSTGSKSKLDWRSSISQGLFVQASKSMEALIKEQSDLYQYSSIRKGALDDMLPLTIIHPEASLKLAWDVMLLVLVIFYGLIVPVRIGFEAQTTPVEDAMDTTADVVFLLDIVLNFRTAYKDDGVLVTDGWLIAKSYLKSWFLLDFIASFPVGWFTSGGSVNRIVRMLRLFKLFRVLRLLKLLPRVSQILETSIKFNPSILRFVRSFAIMLLMWHNIACAYWFVAREEYGGVAFCPDDKGKRECYVNHCVCNLSDPEGSVHIFPSTNVAWYDANYPDVWVPHYATSSSTLLSQYCQALFWAIEVTTGVGGDIRPRSPLEVGFTTVMVVVGLMMYSLIIGSASSALANMDSTATQRRQILDKVTAFMRSRRVPQFFQRIIIDFYDHMWKTPQREADVFRDLPSSLRSRLGIVMNRDLIDRVPIFKLMTANVYVRMVQRLHPNTFLPGEFVIRQGSEAEFLFFIKRGKCDALLPNTEATIFMTLFPGDVFGERGLLFDERRNESFRAVDFLDVLAMSVSDFNELRVTAPSFVAELRRLAAVRERKRLSFELRLLRHSQKLASMPATGASPVTPSSWWPFSGSLRRDKFDVAAAAEEWNTARSQASVAPSPIALATETGLLASPNASKRSLQSGISNISDEQSRGMPSRGQMSERSFVMRRSVELSS